MFHFNQYFDKRTFECLVYSGHAFLAGLSFAVCRGEMSCPRRSTPSLYLAELLQMELCFPVRIARCILYLYDRSAEAIAHPVSMETRIHNIGWHIVSSTELRLIPPCVVVSSLRHLFDVVIKMLVSSRMGRMISMAASNHLLDTNFA